MNYTGLQIKKLEKNIWKYCILLITDKRIFSAILAIYYLSIDGVFAKEIGIILLLGNLFGFIFEIPSGYISDKLGHKNTIIIYKLLLVISSILLILSNNLTMLILSAIALSLGNAFMSGTGSAFMHDTMNALKRNEDYIKVMGKITSIGVFLPILLMIIVPFLVSIDIKMPFIIGLIFDVIGLLTAISLRRIKHSKKHKKEVKETNFKQVIKNGILLGYLPYAMIVAIINSFLVIISVYRAPYQEVIGLDVIWFGVYFGIGRLFASFLLLYSDRIKKLFNINSYLIFEITLIASLMTSLYFINNTIVVISIFCIINGLQWGLSQVTESFILDIIKNSKFKATLLSIVGQMDSLFTGLLGLLIGFLLMDYSYKVMFATMSISLLVISLSIFCYIFYKAKPTKIKST